MSPRASHSEPVRTAAAISSVAMKYAEERIASIGQIFQSVPAVPELAEEPASTGCGSVCSCFVPNTSLDFVTSCR
jgi:hypothetical protein